MIIVAPPDPPANGAELCVHVPSSKSQALRALAAAALAGGGEIRIDGAPGADFDDFALGLAGLGVRITRIAGCVQVEGGIDFAAEAPLALRVGLGAAPARFLLALSALTGRPVTVDGDAPLRLRPMGSLVSALRELGVSVLGEGSLPLTIQGPIKDGNVLVASEDSSQHLSALMLAGAAGRADLKLAPQGGLVSAPYVDLTASVLQAFGCECGSDLQFRRGNHLRPTAYSVEPDWSGSLFVLAIPQFHGVRVFVPGLRLDSLQPDARSQADLKALGIRLVQQEVSAGVLASAAPAEGGIFDVRDRPDSVPALFALAAISPGGARFRGVAHLRHKESDRIASLLAVSEAFGIRASSTEDELVVEGGWCPTQGPDPVHVPCAGDHRIVMAAALLGLRRSCVLDQPEAVLKSFPNFFRHWPKGSVFASGTSAFLADTEAP